MTELDAASNGSVNDARSLREEAVYPPAVLQKRVYIIDEVHMLSRDAFNALLKIMEEPPAHLLFILATTYSPAASGSTSSASCPTIWSSSC